MDIEMVLRLAYVTQINKVNDDILPIQYLSQIKLSMLCISLARFYHKTILPLLGVTYNYTRVAWRYHRINVNNNIDFVMSQEIFICINETKQKGKE